MNWDVVFPGSEMQVRLTRRETFEPRPHQQQAIENVMAGFNTCLLYTSDAADD